MADDTPRGAGPHDLNEGFARWKAQNPEQPKYEDVQIRMTKPDQQWQTFNPSYIDSDHIRDAMAYGMASGMFRPGQWQRVPPQDFYQESSNTHRTHFDDTSDRKPTMESAVLRRYLRMWNVSIVERLDNLSIEAWAMRSDGARSGLLHTFHHNDMVRDFTSAEQVNGFVYETLSKIVNHSGTTAEEVRARQAEQEAVRERYSAEMQERLRRAQEQMFAEFFADRPPPPSPGALRTPEQLAAIDKARKVKRMMDASDNDGVRANAKSSLDKILEKHGLALSDL